MAAANLDALEDDLNNSVSNHAQSELVLAATDFAGDCDSDSSGGASDEEQQHRCEHRDSDSDHNINEDCDADVNPYLLSPPPITGGAPGRLFFAKSYPFSGAVPVIMKELHLMVVRFFLFAFKNAHLGACGENVCRAMFSAYEVIGTRLIQETVGDGADTPLSKACQISIDAATFAVASDALWSIVENALNHFR